MTFVIEKRHLLILNNLLKQYDYSFFVFGSRITGRSKRFSDVDLFYYEEIPNTILLKLEEEFEESDLPYKVDLVNFTTCDESFRQCVQDQYICLQKSSKLDLIERNARGHFAFLPEKLGLDVHEVEGVKIINSGFGSSMFNIAYEASGDTHFSDMARKVKEAFKGQAFAWWIPPSQHNPKLTKILIAEGFVIETIEHAMICELVNVPSFEQKTNLRIKSVLDSALLQDFIRVLEPYDAFVRPFYEKINPEQLQLQEKLFVGYEENAPVSIGILFISGESAGIFSLLTRDDAQGKGYGTDMMRALLSVAKNYACQTVTLSASSDSGYRIYERLGFHKIGEFECFEYKTKCS